ncbi:PX domain-containing protein EREL1-like isoform X1 [Punica granatum]|uniref:PX domain-containing protein EREL1-like isoform X1 n=2 Tax=Punica granatum TaxID=22663 RepID=A0A6P8E992_PUNGR|nr:PX domain-containing protein EREL1-like isoform X1 [Punica granatum]
MQKRSPPKHRHDGTSPLPLGMEWSPPPRKWNGQDTVWPHDHRTGWSYCVTIPSWVVLPKSRDSDPVVFYRVQVGVQSPEGITVTRAVLRRFNDFLKLFTDLKRSFPKKNLPPAPPKGLLRMMSRALLDERRSSLEEWMTKLFSDIDISRSFSVAAFLELEAAARSSFQDANSNSAEALGYANSTSLSTQLNPDSSLSAISARSSVTPEYGSDTAYETSDLGTPRLGRDDISEMGMEDLTLDEGFSNPIEKLVKYGVSNIDEGLFMGQAILEQLEGLPRNKVLVSHVNDASGKNPENGHALRVPHLPGDDLKLFSELDNVKSMGHARKLSADSSGSDVSGTRGSEISNVGISNMSSSGSHCLPGGAEILSATDMQSSAEGQVILPMDQRHKLNRVLFTLQRRLVTAKTDMEDLIIRLNQEIAVSDYLKTKVNDLVVELDSTKQKSIENLEQAILAERERYTQMQWDMEELRQKSITMELKLKSKQDGESSSVSAADQEKDKLLKELDSTKEYLGDLQKRYGELEARSKADVKVLVKEVKSLRSSQTHLKKELALSEEEKSKLEKHLEEEKEMNGWSKTAWRKLLQECESLRNIMEEFSINDLLGDVKAATDSSSAVALIISQARLLVQDVYSDSPSADGVDGMEHKLRKVILNIIIGNAELRRQADSVLYSFTNPKREGKGEEVFSEKPVVDDDSLER